LTEEDARDGDNDALRKAARSGRVEILDWLVDSFGLGIEDVRDDGDAVLQIARDGRHRNVESWLSERWGVR